MARMRGERLYGEPPIVPVILVTPDHPPLPHMPPPEQAAISYWAGRPASLGSYFIGRGEEMNDLESCFSRCRAVVVSGGVGCGKSRLAAEHTHQLKSDGFWTQGGVSLALTLSALAPALGVSVESKSDDEVAGEVQRRLAQLPQGIVWVIDNLTDLDLVSSLVSATGGVRLLITTRDSRRHVIAPTVGFLGIEALGPDAAIELLCSRSETDPKDPLLPEIADTVGRLPLALEALAVRLAEPWQSVEKVLEQLKEAPTAVEMGAFREAVGVTVPRNEGVFASIVGTLRDLPEECRRALSGLGYIADAPVSEGLAMVLMGVDGEGLSEVLQQCGRQGVLSWVDGQVVVHALTVAAIAATNPKGALATTIDRVQTRLMSINRDAPVAMRNEVAHYGEMLAWARKSLGEDDLAVLSLANNLAAGCHTVGRYKEAIRLR
jgi:hypothetical protein